MAIAELTERLAELIVGFGANVQPGQIVAIGTEPGKEALTRAVAVAAYRAGAKFVETRFFDPHIKRARAMYADPDTLEYVPPWVGEHLLALSEHRGALIALSGVVEPYLMHGVEPARLGRDMLPRVRESTQVVEERTTNWTVAPCPTIGWAQLVHPEMSEEAALARLWEEVAHTCRLEAADPAVAWSERMDGLVAVSERLGSLSLDSLHFQGPGTDLQVGLLSSARWAAARFQTVDGIVHAPNLPTEEVFTSPDPARTHGVVTATKPLFLSGVLIEGLRVRFEAGRAVEIDAEQGAETLRALSHRDGGAAALGEVALVDRESRIGGLKTVFYDTLLDENAASHIALGAGFPHLIGDERERERGNRSDVHVDFMIGSSQVQVTGAARDGTEVPLLRGGAWQI